MIRVVDYGDYVHTNREHAKQTEGSILLIQDNDGYLVAPFTEDDYKEMLKYAEDNKVSLEYMVPARASHKSVARLVELAAKIDKLKEEYDLIAGDLMIDATTDLAGSPYTIYMVSDTDWEVSCSSKVSVDLYRPGYLQKLLNDSNDLIKEKPVTYAVDSQLSQLLKNLQDDNFYEESVRDIINGLAADSGHPEMDYDKVAKRIKKTYKANISMLKKVYDLTEVEAADYADKIQRAQNYGVLCDFARCAGRTDIDDFKQDIRSAVGVKESMTLRINNKA